MLKVAELGTNAEMMAAAHIDPSFGEVVFINIGDLDENSEINRHAAEWYRARASEFSNGTLTFAVTVNAYQLRDQFPDRPFIDKEVIFFRVPPTRKTILRELTRILLTLSDPHAWAEMHGKKYFAEDIRASIRAQNNNEEETDNLILLLNNFASLSYYAQLLKDRTGQEADVSLITLKYAKVLGLSREDQLIEHDLCKVTISILKGDLEKIKNEIASWVKVSQSIPADAERSLGLTVSDVDKGLQQVAAAERELSTYSDLENK